MSTDLPFLSPHPDFTTYSDAKLDLEQAFIDDNIRWAKEDGDRLRVTFYEQEMRMLNAERTRRTGKQTPFPLSSPVCLGKGGKAENLSHLPLVSSMEFAESNKDEPINWLIYNLIPTGAIVLLTAPPGQYKTWLALEMARCVGEGAEYLGRSVEAGYVTYVDRENPRALLRERVNKIGPSRNLTLWPFWCEPEPPPLGDQSYLDIAENRKLIVFDSLRRFHGYSENNPEDMAVVMGYLRELTRGGATVLVLHHSGKAEGNVYRGTTEILAGVDVAFALERQKDQARVLGSPVPLTLRSIKHRYIEEQVLNLEFLGSGDRYKFRDVTDLRENEREEIRREQFQEVQAQMSELETTTGKPNQTQMLRAMKEKLEIGKNKGLKLLCNGEGLYWTTECRDGSKLYTALSGFPTFPSPIRGGKQEDPETAWEDLT